MAAAPTLVDLLEHGLQDIYYAELKIHRTLPKVIKACSDRSLAEALSAHCEETAGQIAILEHIFTLTGKPAMALRCEAIEGILEEGDRLLQDFGGTPVGDAAIISTCQSVEHYEIARYGTMRTWARELGLTDIATQLESILEQEKAADDKLTDLAEYSINMAGEARLA